MRLAFLSHTAMGGPFVVGSHHLAASLAAEGHEVLHLSAPVSAAHLLRLRDPFVRARLLRWLRGGSLLSGVQDVVPLTGLPWALARTCAPLMSAYSRLMLTSPLKWVGALKIECADALIIDEPRLAALADGTLGAAIVYRATDLYALMRDDPSIAEAERVLCKKADVLIGTSEKVAAHLRRLSGRHVHVIGNGVDFEHFSAAQPSGTAPEMRLPGERGDRAIYVGAFDNRFSSEAMTAAARAFPSRQFILVGPGSREAAVTIARANVIGLGPVDYAQLPAVLHQCAVGLLPLSAEASNAGRSPMKLFEYAAAGLAVAATSILSSPSRAMPTLCVAGDVHSFPAAVESAFACASNDEAIQESARCARSEDWSAKADLLLSLIPDMAPAPAGHSSWN